MIELVTGTPGAGKTLSVVEVIAKITESAIKKGGVDYVVYTNIAGLKLPHFEITKEQIARWWELGPRSLIVLDEAQTFFPPMPAGAKPPEYIEKLNTHRHFGIDFIIITQHPRLVCTSLRKLVGKHTHVRRMFGTGRTVKYQWDSCEETASRFSTAIRKAWSHPKDCFKWYKSAEVHTKQSFSLPLWLFAVPAAVVGSIALAGYTSGGLIDTVRPDVAIQKIAPTAPPAVTSTMPTVVPLNPPKEDSAPGGAVGVAGAVPVAPKVAGCIVTASRCGCLDAQGEPVQVTQEFCREKSGGMGAGPHVNAPQWSAFTSSVQVAPRSRPNDAPLTWFVQ